MGLQTGAAQPAGWAARAGPPGPAGRAGPVGPRGRCAGRAPGARRACGAARAACARSARARGSRRACGAATPPRPTRPPPAGGKGYKVWSETRRRRTKTDARLHVKSIANEERSPCLARMASGPASGRARTAPTAALGATGPGLLQLHLFIEQEATMATVRLTTLKL